MKSKALRYLSYAGMLGLVLRKSGTPRVYERLPPRPQTAGAEPVESPPKAARKGFAALAKSTLQTFMDDDALTLGAAVAYYTVFSLPPLLLLVISVAGIVFGRQAVQNQIQQQISGLIGTDVAGQVQTMVKSAASSHSGTILGLVFGAAALVFGATGSFVALQDALNKVWHVKPDPKAGGIRSFLGKRVLSFGMIVGIAFLLLVSLAVSAALSAFGGWIASFMPAALSEGFLHAAGVIASFLVIALLFAAMFKFLPDAQIAWREVWVGAGCTSLLFTVGKTLIGLYLGKSGATSAYGAAGSVMLIVLWLYYSTLIVLLGAEFTKIWAEARGREIAPEAGAVRVITEERHERPGTTFQRAQ